MAAKKTLTIGSTKVYRVRGPHPEDPDRFYWQAVRFVGNGKRETIW